MKAAIITEGFQGTGYGHLTRCLSIFQAFKEQDISPFFVANCDAKGKGFLPIENLITLNWIDNPTALYTFLKDFDVAIIDSYLGSIEIYEEIFKIVKRVVYIDDYRRLNYPPGIVVNGTIGAEKFPYSKIEGQSYLLGIKYMPIRKEFWDVEIHANEKSGIKNVLITFGGQDIRALSYPVLNLLLDMHPELNFHFVKGINKIEHDSTNTGQNTFFYSNLYAGQMLELMLNCDIAITAAGQTAYELARIGLPAIAIAVAENQKYNLTGFIEAGFIKREIWYNQNNFKEELADSFNEIYHGGIAERRLYCDGQGARRLIDLLTTRIV